jgi:hypothetical protein
MFTRVTFGSEGAMANADHVIGALAVTFSVIALAELGRAVRFLNVPLGVALLVTPFVFGASMPATLGSVACGIALVVLAFPRGAVRHRWGESQWIIR